MLCNVAIENLLFIISSLGWGWVPKRILQHYFEHLKGVLVVGFLFNQSNLNLEISILFLDLRKFVFFIWRRLSIHRCDQSSRAFQLKYCQFHSLNRSIWFVIFHHLFQFVICLERIIIKQFTILHDIANSRLRTQIQFSNQQINRAVSNFRITPNYYVHWTSNLKFRIKSNSKLTNALPICQISLINCNSVWINQQ